MHAVKLQNEIECLQKPVTLVHRPTTIRDSIDTDEGKRIAFRRHRIHIDATPIGYGLNAISYEYLFKPGIIGLELPVGIFGSYSNAGSPTDNLTGITTALNLKFYFFENGNGFFIGPTIGVGQFSYEQTVCGPFYCTTKIISEVKYPFGLKMGVQIKIVPTFGINIALNGGFIYSNSSLENFGGGQCGINFSF